MTQQLRQSIQLLQLSTPELDALVSDALEQNPLLTDEPSVSSQADEADKGAEASLQPTAGEATTTLDIEDSDIWGEGQARYNDAGTDAGGHGERSSSLSEAIEQRSAAQQSLQDLLMGQIRTQVSTPLEIKMAEAMVDMLDEAGYLPADYRERARQLGIDEAEIERVVGWIQSCEPTGVGSRTLTECLSMQLAERGLLSSEMETVLAYLPDIAKGEFREVCNASGLSREALGERLRLIRSCDPKPASAYDATPLSTVIPEVLVRCNSQGEWHVELNPDTLPAVLFDQDFSRRLKTQVRDKDELKVINEHASHANWLIRSLEQRNRTLLTVGTEIVRLQEDFFAFGVRYLKPMTLRDIAEAANCHESTVSRITTQKYLMSQRGTFELKYFFNATLHNANGGQDYSSRSVMDMIQTMIAEETPDAILSDDAMAEALKRRGIDVARRTVVKYRKQLGIGSSVERRRKAKPPCL